MKARLHPVLIVFLAVFAAGMVMHTAAATAMSLDMALVQDKAMQMDGCAGCDGNDMAQGGAVCDMDCTLSFAAILPEVAALSSPPSPALRVFSGVALAGRTGPPDLFPPRTTFLN